jgi:hypothetical protein
MEKRPMRSQWMPSIRDFETVQKEARRLLHKLQRNDARASERYHQFDAVDVLPARLSDAQYLVARRYGFKSWAALKAFIPCDPTADSRRRRRNHPSA